MAELTPNYKLTKPAQEDMYNIDTYNKDQDIIDMALKRIEDKADKGNVTADKVVEAINEAIEAGTIVNANRLEGFSSNTFATANQGAKADGLVNGDIKAGDSNKLGGEAPEYYANQNNTYTKSEVNNKILESTQLPGTIANLISSGSSTVTGNYDWKTPGFYFLNSGQPLEMQVGPPMSIDNSIFLVFQGPDDSSFRNIVIQVIFNFEHGNIISRQYNKLHRQWSKGQYLSITT